MCNGQGHEDDDGDGDDNGDDDDDDDTHDIKGQTIHAYLVH